MRWMLPKIFLLFLPDFVQGECAHIEGCGSLSLAPLLEYDKIKDKHEGLLRRRRRFEGLLNLYPV